MAQSSPARTILTVVMDVLVFVAVAETARLVIMFFGQLASTSWGETFIALTELTTINFGFEAIKTPYGGVFDVNAAVTVAVLLVIEWILSIARSRS